MILILQCVMVCVTSPLLAQKIVPFTFSHETDSSSESSLEVLTEVNESTSTFIRLYFKGTQLGRQSYLLLEATDGAKQQLRNEDLENWSFSSAYFNGSNVKVSLFSGKGELNKVFINAIKVSDGKIQTSNRITTGGRENLTNQSTNINSAINYDLNPYAAAVGRFTDGNDSYGTGWIAPNGAIVTSHDAVHGVTHLDWDIIEFNVPPSNSYGSVNHPGPEDQYPVKYHSETQSIIGFNFKRKHHYSLENEDNGSWNTTWGILEALPNSTGMRPGERQQQFFRIAPNLGSFTLKTVDVWVDIFHYGETNEDLLDGTKFRTLKKHSTKLVPQDEYIGSADKDIESYMVYTLDEGNLTFTDSDTGAPITFNDHNIAMGVHTDFYNYAPAVGAGFKNGSLLTSLNDYFSSVMVYVDQGSEWDPNTGAIDKPYFEIRDGIEHAEIGGIVNIVKGNYNEPMYITKAVTLKAPVGHVLIGGGGGELNARKATLPQEFFMEQEVDNLASGTTNDSRFDLKSFPNPFTSSTDINYEIVKSTSVRVSVLDKIGNKVRSLLQEFQQPGIHSVVWDGTYQNGAQATPGLYVVRIETPEYSATVKIIKR